MFITRGKLPLKIVIFILLLGALFDFSWSYLLNFIPNSIRENPNWSCFSNERAGVTGGFYFKGQEGPAYPWWCKPLVITYEEYWIILMVMILVSIILIYKMYFSQNNKLN